MNKEMNKTKVIYNWLSKNDSLSANSYKNKCYNYIQNNEIHSLNNINSKYMKNIIRNNINSKYMKGGVTPLYSSVFVEVSNNELLWYAKEHIYPGLKLLNYLFSDGLRKPISSHIKTVMETEYTTREICNKLVLCKFESFEENVYILLIKKHENDTASIINEITKEINLTFSIEEDNIEISHIEEHNIEISHTDNIFDTQRVYVRGVNVDGEEFVTKYISKLSQHSYLSYTTTMKTFKVSNPENDPPSFTINCLPNGADIIAAIDKTNKMGERTYKIFELNNPETAIHKQTYGVFFNNPEMNDLYVVM
jgi:hypothetical protein